MPTFFFSSVSATSVGKMLIGKLSKDRNLDQECNFNIISSVILQHRIFRFGRDLTKSRPVVYLDIFDFFPHSPPNLPWLNVLPLITRNSQFQEADFLF